MRSSLWFPPGGEGWHWRSRTRRSSRKWTSAAAGCSPAMLRSCTAICRTAPPSRFPATRPKDCLQTHSRSHSSSWSQHRSPVAYFIYWQACSRLCRPASSNFINKNINEYQSHFGYQSEGEAGSGGGLSPEVAELLVAFGLLDAADDPRGVVGDLHDILDLDEVDAQDEYAVEGVGGLVVGSEDPVVVAVEAVLAADDHVVAAHHCVVAADDDVVVLDQLRAHLLQQVDHLHHLLVDRVEGCSLPEQAGHCGLHRAVPAESFDALEGEEGGLEDGAQQAALEGEEGGAAVEVLLQGQFQAVDGTLSVPKQQGVYVQSREVALPAHRHHHHQDQQPCFNSRSFHLEFNINSNFEYFRFRKADLNQNLELSIKIIPKGTPKILVLIWQQCFDPYLISLSHSSFA